MSTVSAILNPQRDDEQMQADPKQVDTLFLRHREAVFRQTDRMFSILMLLQWAGCVLVAVWISPLTWIGASSAIHVHVLAALVLGGVIASWPVLLAYMLPGAALTRHVIGIAQMCFGALLIHLTGGRIETHFHIFGSLAFLAFYRDWRVLMTASAVVLLDHMLRGMLWPQSIFGVLAAGSWRWVEHAGWVVFINIFLVGACVRGVREMRAIAQRQAEVEHAHATTELTVRSRTKELHRAKLEAERAVRVKSEFLANMSHEIRTPMTAILGYTDLLSEQSIPEHERRDAILTVRRNGEHLLAVLNDILDLSKMEMSQMTVEAEPCSPFQVVADVTSLMRVRAASKNLELNVKFDMPMPETIRSDALRMRQILMNLIGNAVKFTEHGSITLHVRYDKDSPDNQPTMHFDVIDTGIGMSEDQVKMLFQPFTQVDTSAKRRFGGTGLGLTISKRLAELLGGSIVVSSTPDVGSTFTFSAPTRQHADVRMITDASEAMNQTDSPQAKPSATDHVFALKGKVLLAEDGPDNQRLLGFVLRKAGLDVEVVSNGQQAVDAAMQAWKRGELFDVILMDMQMPELDGYEATGCLRKEKYPGAIVALTAHSMSDDRAKCINAGCDDYVTKPIDRVHLLQTIEAMIDPPQHKAA